MATYSELQREIQKGGKKKKTEQEFINERKRNPENRKETEQSNKETKKKVKEKTEER